jgi:uncharacterized protein YjiK
MMKKLIQTKCPVWFLTIVVYAVTLQASCKQRGSDSPAGYDLNKPKKMELGKVLNEISGLCFNEEDSSLLAISDSKEKVFGIELKKLKLKDLTGKVVPSNSDLEDVVKVDNTFYLLSSSGKIIAVPNGAQDTAGTARYGIDLQGKNDFETLYYDPSVQGLVMMCKSCSFEKGAHLRTAFRFDLTTKKFDSTAFFTISKAEVEAILKDKDIKFDPSAAAINPVNKRLFILSSAGNLLVIADTKGKAIEAYKLNPDKFPQAEGIAFAPNGDMYISNEGKFGKATLLFFPYHQGKKNK